MIHNPSLSVHVASSVAEWLVKDWEAFIRGEPYIVGSPWLEFAFLIQQHGDKIQPDVIRRVYAFSNLACQADENTCQHAQRPSNPDHAQGRDYSRFATSTLRDFSRSIANLQLLVPPDVLCSALPFLLHEPTSYLALLRHPNTNATVLRKALQLSPWSQDVAVLVAENSELRWDPEIRKQLLNSTLPRVLTALIEDADPNTAACLLRRLIADNHLSLAASILMKRSADRPIMLDSADLTPLLQSRDQNVRLAAVTYLGQLKAPPPEHESVSIDEPTKQRNRR